MAASPNVLIVEAPYYRPIADLLVEGTMAELRRAGAAFDRVDVPGTFEIPAAIAFALDRYDGFIALGCVIRGETTHYDYICMESARGLMDLSVRFGVPIGYGILTCENEEQAIVRADPNQKNKGKDAAVACLRMIELKRQYVGN